MQVQKQCNLWRSDVGITNGFNLWHPLLNWPHVAWYKYTRFYEEWSRHSSNIEVITWRIREAAVLITLMGRIYEVRNWDDLRWHDILTKFHDARLRHSRSITVITFTIWEDAAWELLTGGIYEARHWGGLRCTDVHAKFHEDSSRC